jgi:hypothetical protein
MVGDTARDSITGQEFEVVHDFAHHNRAADLLFPDSDAPITEAQIDLALESRPRIEGSGRRVGPKYPKE